MDIHDNDLKKVLSEDGVNTVIIEELENVSTTSVKTLQKKMGNEAWAARLVKNDRFGGVIIQQRPGEGNRLHYHPDDDECWVILAGTWEWFIEGEGTKTVSEHDIVVVPKGIKHKITCKGTTPGIRFAITAPDVTHVYAEE